MILASAGSGKTYALTNRFIALLARGAAPEKIAALTFTRKAAGEFFDEILRKLAQAADEGEAAQRLARDIGMPDYAAPDFLRLLRSVVAAMHRLQLGTLDSFFARVVRAFPLELGIGGDFDVLQDHAAQLERQRVMRKMFSHAASASTARQDFIEAFKRATFGVEEKQLGARLDGFLDEHAEIFLSAQSADFWGRRERIWPDGCDWFDDCDAKKREEAARALQQRLPWSQFNEKQAQRWQDFFAALPTWAAGGTLPKPVEYLLKNTLAAWPELREIVVERKRVALPPAAIEALKKLVCGIVGAELARRLEMTQGIHAVLQCYDQVYDAAVRRAGRLTFADVQRVLRPLTREADAVDRLYIDWRLDARIDHWLLDEFQDTSRAQWSVLRNLIDEVVQDPGGARTFFYVGDVKQAIFAWREGDPRLFREIFDYYNAAGGDVVHEERLDQSWRSGPAVIAMVNRVLGDAAALGGLFPAAAVERWAREWREHRSARPDLGGYAELLHAEDARGRFAETLRIIQETAALERGLSVAVLVQKNETASELADFLRQEGGVPAVAEADRLVATDNPFTSALLALCRGAAHPGDRAAHEQLAAVPRNESAGENSSAASPRYLGTADALSEQFLAAVHRDGFERALGEWVNEFEAMLRPGDDFSRLRARQFLAAARLFDETGSRDVAQFVQFMERHKVRDADEAGVVRVMTVHKAKGLGFDVVILPDLEGTKLAARRRMLAVQHAGDRSLDWILDLPPSLFYTCDPVLSAHVQQAEADACYEEFAVLYVAMTRAKRAMYVITQPVGRTSTSHNFPRLLQETLGDEWSSGDRAWFEKIPPAGPRPLREISLPVVDLATNDGGLALRARRTAHRPSSGRSMRLKAADVFRLHANAARERGRGVHALLAEVEWLETGGGSQWRKRWVGEGEVGEEAANCLLSAGLQSIWRRPAGADIEVWRERPFEIVLDGEWISGVFDRVMVAKDATGAPVAATVLDFKTDLVDAGAVADAANRHAHQMENYRRAVAVLTGLRPEAVAATVVFTRAALMVVLKTSSLG